MVDYSTTGRLLHILLLLNCVLGLCQNLHCRILILLERRCCIIPCCTATMLHQLSSYWYCAVCSMPHCAAACAVLAGFGRMQPLLMDHMLMNSWLGSSQRRLCFCTSAKLRCAPARAAAAAQQRGLLRLLPDTVENGAAAEAKRSLWQFRAAAGSGRTLLD